MAIEGYADLVRLHEGGQAVVYRARRETDGRSVVLKVLRGPYPTPEAVARFRREAEITAAVQGPGVIGLHSAELEGRQPFLVLEDFGARSLQEHFDGPVDPRTVAGLALRVVSALARVHDRLVLHKDIGPTNIVWSPESGELKLIDFGIASTVSRERPALAEPDVIRGTLATISPEQTGRMNRSVDYRSDYYSLGATLFILLTGRPPFAGSDPLELVHAHVARRPPDPRELVPEVPENLAAVVLKLLAKTAEERYQSPLGLEEDLRRCLATLRNGEPTHAFALGLHDRPAQVQIPERLYGREREVAELVAAVERTRAGGREFVLVSGYSGVGKTSLVHEIHRPLVGGRSLFLTGKFDQFRRGTPYASLAAAFGHFCLGLLAGGEDELRRWKAHLGTALEEGAAVLAELIPELELVLGPQPDPPPVPPSEAEIRLHVLFQRFVRTLARADHPLVLFVDDLQWADLPTIRLLEVLAGDLGLGHLLILGAYRDNEVDASHPLTHTVDTLRGKGIPVHRLALEHLGEEDVGRFVRDALHDEGPAVDELAALCFEKTAGNPFFLGQFLLSLEETGVLGRDPRGGWTWDREGLEAAALTENVVELLAGKILRLPEDARRALCTASILGNDFRLEVLERVAGGLETEVGPALGPALREGLLVPLDTGSPEAGAAEFAFSHDRVQQAAYSLLPEPERRSVHRRIGKLLQARAANLDDDDVIFEVTEHLNAARSLLFEDEKRELARLNKVAARRARRSAAYGAARTHALAGIELLGKPAFVDHYELACELRREAATAAYLVRLFDEADAHVDVLLEEARDSHTAVRAYEVRMASRIAQNLSHEAIRVGVEALARLGVRVPEEPDLPAVGAAMADCGGRLAAADLEALAAGPEVKDTAARDAMRLLMSIAPPAYLVRPLLMPLLATHIVGLTVEHGVAPESAYGFALYGLVLCSAGHVDAGYAMGSYGTGLTERFPAARRESVRAHHVHYGFVKHWKDPISEFLPRYAALFQEGVAAGDYEYAGFAAMLTGFLSFHSGRPLEQLEPEMARWTEAMGVFQQNVSLALHCIAHQAALNLMGEAEDPLVLTGAAYDEGVMIPMFRQIGDPTCLFVSHLFKTIVAVVLREDDAAWESLQVAMEYQEAGGTSTFHLPVLFTLHALLCLRRYRADGDEALLEAAAASRARVEAWAATGEVNLGQKVALIDAEWARARGDDAEAMRLYEVAVERARDNAFLSDEALANELAARFYLDRDRGTIARAFLLEARFAWLRWGARAKVERLDAEFPEWLASVGSVRVPGSLTSVTGTVGGGATDLDAAAVLRASQAISQEIVLSRLLATLVTLALESSGARKAVLLLIRDGRFVLAAEGRADPELRIEVPERPSAEFVADAVPEAVVQYVRRTGREVLLFDARREGLFTRDPYVLKGDVRSVLALPVVHKGEMNAVLYLENDLTAGVFTGERLALARVLLTQAAISIDNAVLYESLEDKVRERTQALEEARQEAEAAHQRSDALLKNVLPSRIAEVLKVEGRAEPVHVASASVLFTDFVGFTSRSAELSPAQLVDELERCFGYFDEVMDRHGVEKLKTIGDAYMAAGGIPEPNATHVVDLLLAALEVADFVARDASQRGFSVRIGVHTGPLVAGVIGRRRFLYDVWGDTVNTASRLEAAGAPGRVNIATAAWETARHLFECTPRGPIPVKGKGELEMYFVDRIRPEYSADEAGRTPNAAFAAKVAELTG